MSNMDRLLRGGGKKKAAPVAPLTRGKEPQVDDTPTHDLSVAAGTPAQEEAPTTEYVPKTDGKSDGKGAKVLRIGEGSPVGAVVSPTPAPAEAEDDDFPSSKDHRVPRVPQAPKPDQKAELLAEVKAAVEATVKELLGPVMKKIEALEQVAEELKAKSGEHDETLQGNDEDLTFLLEAVDGSEENKVPGLKAEVANLVRSLFGEEAEAAIAEFEGRPVVSTLKNGIVESLSRMDELIGPDGERVPVLLHDQRVVTRDLAVAILRMEFEDSEEGRQQAKKAVLENIARLAIQRVPSDTKEVIEEMVANPRLVKEVLARFHGLSITIIENQQRLADPQVAETAASVEADMDFVMKRAQYALKAIDWNKLEERAAAIREQARAPEEGGESS
ncbi:MAG: hypothetical protein AB1324_08015 [Candidatus Micrarchaeota archaeon]